MLKEVLTEYFVPLSSISYIISFMAAKYTLRFG